MTKTVRTKPTRPQAQQSAEPPLGNLIECPAAESPTAAPTPVGGDDAPALPLQAGAAAAKGKLGLLIDLLRRDEGATIEHMTAATGWQAHSVRGAISGALKKRLGFNIASRKSDAGRTYRIIEGAAA